MKALAPEAVEAARIRALQEYAIEPRRTEGLDNIAKLAAQICRTGAAMVSIVESDRQVFVGSHGTDLCETARDQSFCNAVVQGFGPLVVNDATKDSRFCENPLVKGGPKIRFYAGHPLITPEGQPLGAICVIAPEPRDGLTADELDGLRLLAGLAMSLLEEMRNDARAIVAQSYSQSRIDELEQKFAVLADSLPQLVWSTSPDGMSDYFNRQWCDFTGQTAAASFGTRWLSFLHPDDVVTASQVWNSAVESGGNYEVHYRLRRYDGTYRWVVARGLPLTDDRGAIIRWIGTCTDIHGEISTADKLELVTQELHHRIKNIFAVIGGLVSLSSRASPQAQEFAADLYDRILALGRAHSFVGGGAVSEAASLRGMLENLLLPYRDARTERIEILGDDVAIDDRSATPLALIFHELATNSAKYGAFRNGEGRVVIRIDASRPVTLQWIETGTGPASREMASGFGSHLLKLSIERQLGGKYRQAWTENGLEMAITIPSENLHRSLANPREHRRGN